jgi:glycine/D-amino acid oxidase-like deaminating enzyme
VLGGGTAGLTIANRLAERHTVAVIEAGGFYEYTSTPIRIPVRGSY